jgi:phage FluMu protein Com
LLARLVASGVELKCRRCKRIVVLPFQTERAR